MVTISEVYFSSSNKNMTQKSDFIELIGDADLSLSNYTLVIYGWSHRNCCNHGNIEINCCSLGNQTVKCCDALNLTSGCCSHNNMTKDNNNYSNLSQGHSCECDNSKINGSRGNLMQDEPIIIQLKNCRWITQINCKCKWNIKQGFIHSYVIN